MWKLLCKIPILCLLCSCQQELNIQPAHDLNQLYRYSEPRIFSVEVGFLQKIQCQDLENWAQKHLTHSQTDYYVFVHNHDEIHFKSNRYLKDEYDIMVFEHKICEMNGLDKKCFICRE